MKRIALALMLLTTSAFAHDHNRPDLDGWYGSLRSGRGPCCGGPTVDAVTLDGPDWDTKDGHFRVRLEGEWRDVPEEAVVNEPNKDGRALVWPIYYRSFGAPVRIDIRCFMPGMQG